MKSRLLVTLFPALVVVVASLAACATEGQPPVKTAGASITQAETSSACPLGVPGAHVVVDDTDVGVMMTFTATADRLGDLRERARDAAAMHGPGQHLGKGHDGRHSMGGDHGLKAMQLPPAFAGEEDIDGGARIRLTPADAADRDVLRAKVRERATAMMAECK